MGTSRLLGLLSATLLIVAVASVSAQPGPGIKLSPQIKPPATGPVTGPGAAPVGKAPIDPKMGGKTGTPGTGTGGSGSSGSGGSSGGGGGPTSPLIKGDPGKWPKEVGGKNLETTIQDLKSSTDPAIREAAVRALPYFGPKARELGAAQLALALRDSDVNVKVAAQ